MFNTYVGLNRDYAVGLVGQKPPRETAQKEVDLLKDLALQKRAVKGERRVWD